jgi:hypothetical protein
MMSLSGDKSKSLVEEDGDFPMINEANLIQKI